MNERRREEILLFSWPQRDVDRMQLSVMSGLARQIIYTVAMDETNTDAGLLVDLWTSQIQNPGVTDVS